LLPSTWLLGLLALDAGFLVREDGVGFLDARGCALLVAFLVGVAGVVGVLARLVRLGLRHGVKEVSVLNILQLKADGLWRAPFRLGGFLGRGRCLRFFCLRYF
jgi:hypothetical protein